MKLKVKSLSEENEVKINYCEFCLGSGQTEDLSKVTGNNIAPEGYYEVDYKPCFNCK